MIHLTDDETRVLRITLGLHETRRRSPSRNVIHQHYVDKYRHVIDVLVHRGFMFLRTKDCGSLKAGTYAATDAGREAVLDQQWK